jgi:hypothetical protein
MNQQQTLAFVVLHHIVPEELQLTGGRGTHYDLMLESNGALKTWAIDRWPLVIGDAEAQASHKATRLADHRLAYLSYQGPLSHNRGEVCRVAAGTYRTLPSGGEPWQVELRWQDASGIEQLMQLSLQSSQLVILKRS